MTEHQAATVEEVEHLRAFGLPDAELVERLGTTATALAKVLRRAGRPDLARPFDNLRRLERPRGSCVDCGAPTSRPRFARCRACGHRARLATRTAATV